MISNKNVTFLLRCGILGKMMFCIRCLGTLTQLLVFDSVLMAPSYFQMQWTTQVSTSQWNKYIKKNRRNSFSKIMLPTFIPYITVHSIVVDAFFGKTAAVISWLGPGFTAFLSSLFSLFSSIDIYLFCNLSIFFLCSSYVGHPSFCSPGKMPEGVYWCSTQLWKGKAAS